MRGGSNKAIAAELAVSLSTVRTHVQSILRKLGAHSKLEAVSSARERGVLRPGHSRFSGGSGAFWHPGSNEAQNQGHHRWRRRPRSHRWRYGHRARRHGRTRGSRSRHTALDRANRAALAHTGGGRVTGTEVGDEESYYEVEVTRSGGGQVDVQLDRSFKVVSQAADDDRSERNGTAGD